MTSTYVAIEHRIQKAINALNTRQNPSQTSTEGITGRRRGKSSGSRIRFRGKGPGYRRDLHLRHIIYRREVPTAGSSYQCVDRTLQEAGKLRLPSSQRGH